MNKQIALAYGIAGLAVAIALVTVIDTNTGLFGGGGEAALTSAPEQSVDTAPVEPAVPVSSMMSAAEAPEAPVEIVYVDEPAGSRRGDGERYEDDDDHERYERHERHERDEHGEDDD